MTDNIDNSEHTHQISLMLSDIHQAINNLLTTTQKQTQLLEHQHSMYNMPNHQQPTLQTHAA